MAKVENKNETIEKPKPNPYNLKKSWHTDDVMPTGGVETADSLFVAPKAEVTTSDEGDQQREPAVKSKPYQKPNYKKRYDDLKRYYDRKLGEWSNKEGDLKAQLRDNRPKYIPPKSADELSAFKKDYPDIYGVVETVSHLQSQTEMKGLQEEVDSLKKSNIALSQREAQLELAKFHLDFNTIKESDDFHNWADSQPMEIKKWVYENTSDGRLAARAVDLYKKDRGLGLDKKTTEDKPVTQGADLLVKTNEQIQPPTNNKVIFKSSDFEKMSDAEFEKNEKNILIAQREGRITKG